MDQETQVDTIESLKGTIRNEMREKRKGLDPEVVLLKSGQIGRNLFKVDEFKASRNVLFYLSLPREVQTDGMIRQAFDLGKQVYVPVVDGKKGGLKISELPGLDVEFETGTFGERQPGKNYLKIVPSSVLDFVVTPGLAFDFRGGRIGYGVGYYDRFLKELSETVQRVAVSFDFQVIDSVPQAPYDVPVQKIITEYQTIHC